jgi:hypothetical protein
MAATTTAINVFPPAGEPARTLDRIVETAEQICGVRAEDVQVGDWIVVKTKNSSYCIAAISEGVYRVSGGWFATNHEEDRDVRIAGCTWGGAVIHTRLVAAIGMYLEFDNGVRTTRIRDIRIVRGGDDRQH